MGNLQRVFIRPLETPDRHVYLANSQLNYERSEVKLAKLRIGIVRRRAGNQLDLCLENLDPTTERETHQAINGGRIGIAHRFFLRCPVKKFTIRDATLRTHS